MTRRVNAKRKLVAESLESRQLLHGGGMGVDTLPIEDRVASAFERYDANEDMELSEAEVSERLWARISVADGEDENATVSADELASHLETQAEETDAGERRERQRNDREGRRDGGRNSGEREGGERVTAAERVDAFFAENDTNEDGIIDAEDEVPEALLARLAEADIDGDGISSEDLLARLESREGEREQSQFDARFARLDDDGDGGVIAEEAGELHWERLSPADADDDGSVTSDELQAYLEAERAEREEEREASTEAEVAVEMAAASAEPGRQARGERQVRRGQGRR